MPPAVPTSCSASSRAAGEGVWGSANEGVTTWLMVEHEGPWGAKVPKQAEQLPAQARAHLLALDAREDLRVELIRRPLFGAGPAKGVHVYVGRVDEDGGALWHLHLPDDAALAGLDPDAVARGEGEAARLVDRPVFFVCTHGTRDACCALHGMPVYRALALRHPAHTWQCSHLGGHRFAPTLLVLPHGAVYGRVAADAAPALADAALAGRLHDPSALRGRSCYPRAVQAAEAMVRARTGVLELAALHVRSVDALGRDRWRVRFDVAGRGVEEVELVRERLPLPVLGGCGDEAPELATNFRAVD